MGDRRRWNELFTRITQSISDLDERAAREADEIRHLVEHEELKERVGALENLCKLLFQGLEDIAIETREAHTKASHALDRFDHLMGIDKEVDGSDPSTW